jgi:hypothetical protein
MKVVKDSDIRFASQVQCTGPIAIPIHRDLVLWASPSHGKNPDTKHCRTQISWARPAPRPAVSRIFLLPPVCFN